MERSEFRHCVQNEITFPTKDQHTSSCVLHAKATCYHPINTRWRNCFPSSNFWYVRFFSHRNVNATLSLFFFNDQVCQFDAKKISTEPPRAVILGRGMTYWFISVCGAVSERSMRRQRCNPGVLAKTLNPTQFFFNDLIKVVNLLASCLFDSMNTVMQCTIEPNRCSRGNTVIPKILKKVLLMTVN